MRHTIIPAELFTANRARLAALLPPHSLAVANANDVLPSNGDGSLPSVPNSDLFWLSGIEQEESILLLYPDAYEETSREILFLRQPNDELKIWEGHKHSKEQAREISGIKTIKWLSEFPRLFRGLMCDVENVYLNSNEHKRASTQVASRDDRFVREVRGAVSPASLSAAGPAASRPAGGEIARGNRPPAASRRDHRWRFSPRDANGQAGRGRI